MVGLWWARCEYLGGVAEDLGDPNGVEHEETQVKHAVEVIHHHEAGEDDSVCVAHHWNRERTA